MKVLDILQVKTGKKLWLKSNIAQVIHWQIRLHIIPTILQDNENKTLSYKTSSHRIEILQKVRYQYRSSHQRCPLKKGVLKIFAKLTGKPLCLSIFFTQVFSCELCKKFKNSFFTEFIWNTASVNIINSHCGKVSLHIPSECGKLRIRKTPNTGHFSRSANKL